MQRISLFREAPKQAVELEYPKDLDHGCSRCSLARGTKTVCMPADGDPGGLLVVGDHPTEIEDRGGRPFISPGNTSLRKLVEEFWTGPVVYDTAVRCAPGQLGRDETAVNKCRGYLAGVVRDAQPTRILAVGSKAIEALLGRKVPPETVRRGYAYLSTGVPVFMAFSPTLAARNRHMRTAFRDDIEWALTATPMFPPQFSAVANVVQTAADAQLAEAALTKAKWVSYDVETAGKPFAAFQILTAALFPVGSSEGWVWSPEAMLDAGARAPLARLLSNPKVGKVGNNLKYDLTASELEFNIACRGFKADNRLIRKLIQADAQGDLDTMAELVGMGGHKAEAEAALDVAVSKLKRVSKEMAGQQMALFGRDLGFLKPEVLITYDAQDDEAKSFAYGMLPRDVLLRYVARDALASRMLEEQMEADLATEAPGIRLAWNKIVKPAAEAIRQVEQWGVAVDLNAITNFQSYLGQRKAELKSRMMQWGDFEPGNPYSVGAHLFEKLKLPGGVKTGKSGQWSTAAEVLEDLAKRSSHPLPSMVVAYKKLEKMDGTYATGMKVHIRDDGRIHTKLLLDGTTTGRLSSQMPNLQNIPRDADTAEGRMARNCFVAPEGRVLLSADFSQLELRIAAALSGDEGMREIFEMGGDFHQRTAEFIAPLVWHIKPEEVQKRHRSAAKSFVFGLLYGMGDEAVAHKAGCTVQEAAKIRAVVLGKFTKLADFIKKCLQYSQRTGVCWTWWDGERARRRPLWDIADPDQNQRITSENSSFNTPIQGTGSDFCLMSLTAMVQWIIEDAVPAKLVLPVHDSLMIEVDEACVDEAAYQLKRIMTGWNSNGVPLQVDMDIGYAWGSMQKYDQKRCA